MQAVGGSDEVVRASGKCQLDDFLACALRQRLADAHHPITTPATKPSHLLPPPATPNTP